MPHYLLRWQLTSGSVKSLIGKPQDRSTSARKLIEGFGGKMISYYFSFGEYDGVGIVEMPDNISVAACSLEASASGGFSRFETTPLLTPKEAREAMQKAHDANTGYRPPNA